MFALIVIWLVAALLGFVAAVAWEPLLELVLATARTVDPGFAILLDQYADIARAGGDAIGWLVAIAVGVPLTLLWLIARAVMRSVNPQRPAPASPRERRVPHGAAYEARRSSEPRVERAPEPRPPAPAPPRPAPPPEQPAPRWGRQ